jgi:hypothetical protein
LVYPQCILGVGHHRPHRTVTAQDKLDGNLEALFSLDPGRPVRLNPRDLAVFGQLLRPGQKDLVATTPMRLVPAVLLGCSPDPLALGSHRPP